MVERLPGAPAECQLEDPAGSSQRQLEVIRLAQPENESWLEGVRLAEAGWWAMEKELIVKQRQQA